MNQQELEALLAEIAPNRMPGRLDFSEGTAEVDVESTDPATLTTTKKKVPARTLTWIDPGTGMTLVVRANDDGTYTKVSQGRVEKNIGAAATTAAQQQAAAGGSERTPVKGHPGIYVVKTVKQQPDGSSATETHYEDENGRTVPEPAAPATRNETPVTVNGKNLIKVETVDPATGQSKTVLLDPVTRAEVQAPEPPKPAPQGVPADPRQKWIAREDATTREVEFVRNPNYAPPSQLVPDPATGRLRVLTEDDDGRPVLKDLTDQTTIKPNDIPVLQATYGRIGQSLGAYLTDLNGRVSRGEMTPQERDAAFKAAHQQAEVQVGEINSILENSKAVWTAQVQERGQTFGEAANRRSFASSIMNNAVDTGREIAAGALPGSGRAIAEGVMTLMDMGQRYAGGMGGFPSMAPTALPPALEQAAGMGLPGFGPESGGPPAPGGPPPPGPSTRSMVGIPAAAPPSGGAPPGRPAPLLPPPPPVPGSPPVAPPVGLAPAAGGPTPSPLPFTGQDPNPTPLGSPLGALGAMFGAGMAGSPMGVPASAGGGGLFDPSSEGAQMISASTSPGSFGGDGVADTEWERAVRAAMGLFG